MILAFGCVLNPFLKFEFLEYLYDKLGHDTETVKAKVNNVRKAIYALLPTKMHQLQVVYLWWILLLLLQLNK
jgi:hypothetical protein